MIRHAVGSNGDAIVALGRLTRNQPVRYIECHLLGIAIGGFAETAPARQFEPDEIAARYALPALGADRFAGDQGDPACGALAAAVAAPGRVADPLEIAQHRDRRTVGSAQFDNLAETAAVAPGPARPLPKLAPAEQHRCHRLGCLDRDRAYAGGKRGHIEPILAWPRPGATAMKDRGAEGLDVGRRPPLPRSELIEHVRTAIDLRDPQG